jgi:hypothetical protein
MFGLFGNKDLDEFGRRLARETSGHVPVSSAGASRPNAKALQVLKDEVANYRRTRSLGVLKQLRISRAFQAELTDLGYEDEFIKQVTLTLVQALSGK